MKLYNEEGFEISAEKEQLPALEKAGWSRINPKVEKKELPDDNKLKRTRKAIVKKLDSEE